MALSKVVLSTRFGDKFAKESDAGSTATVIESSAATVYSVQANNTAVSSDVFVKLYNNASPTIGTSSPDMILKIPASTVKTYHFTSGVVFATALSVACLTAAGTGGVVDPGTVVVKIVYT